MATERYADSEEFTSELCKVTDALRTAKTVLMNPKFQAHLRETEKNFDGAAGIAREGYQIELLVELLSDRANKFADRIFDLG